MTMPESMYYTQYPKVEALAGVKQVVAVAAVAAASYEAVFYDWPHPRLYDEGQSPESRVQVSCREEGHLSAGKNVIVE
jgi:hypothetical protein